MKVTGIICEYNPFHNGHKFHIEQTRQLCSSDYIIGIMSGPFTQRGTPAITDKYSRAKMALANGCDIVLELPVRYAASSAEGFAHGAINTLKATNIVDSICFGTEEGSLEHFNMLAEIIENEPLYYKKVLSESLKNGLTYPQARNKALAEYLSDIKTSDSASVSASDCKSPCNPINADINQPNNILAIEYLRACKKTGLTAHTIKRSDAGYHETSLSEHALSTATKDSDSAICCSASAIRNEIYIAKTAKNDTINSLNRFVPYKASSFLSFPLNEDDFSLQLYTSLVTNCHCLSSFTDISPDLAARINNNITSFENWTQFVTLLKTKQFTYTRVQRALCHCMLSLNEAKINNDYPASYIRVLGFKKSAGKLLKQLSKNSAVPVITKASMVHSQTDLLTKKMLKEDIYAAELYNKTYAFKYSDYNNKNEYTRNIVITE